MIWTASGKSLPGSAMTRIAMRNVVFRTDQKWWTERSPCGSRRSIIGAKATETLALYMLQGQPANPFGSLDKHFDAGIKAATASGDAQHEVVLRWLHATARIMVTNSLWWATRTVPSRMWDFVHSSDASPASGDV